MEDNPHEAEFTIFEYIALQQSVNDSSVVPLKYFLDNSFKDSPDTQSVIISAKYFPLAVPREVTSSKLPL
ncbi:hypothetical protein D7X33_48725, partial [Butyricicoccus sp. 1XD8-22]